jgi:branched-chain amino acid transport system substrate-binding protein
MVLGACGSSKTADAPAATPAPAATEAEAPAATEAEAPAATEAEAPAATEAEAPAATEAEAPAADGAATAGEGCGLNNGEKASGDPIVLGNVTTSIPGIDFSVGPAMMDAYFRCVNENGGINGRPIAMKMENDNGTPDDAAAAARKLIETDKVVGMVGGFSILDCPVNAAYYEEKGYNVIVAGVPGECFGSPNIAAANMGPGYSSLGASQVMVDKGAKGKIVTMTGKAPNSEYNNSLAAKHIVASGLETEDIQLDLPINDPTAAILDAVERAGEGGGVLLTFTPPEGLKLLKAAEEQGLIDKVIWGSATPLNDTFVAQQLGAPWKGKLNINAEFSLLDDPRPEVELARQVQAEYNTDAKSFGSFEQMGFVMGRIIVHTLLQMDPADLDDSVAVNAAIKAIANFKSDHLCKPWYFGGLPDGNVPNNTDYNVVPNGTDKMELDQDCFAIAEVEPVLTAVRAAEAAGGLNDG